MSSLRIQIAPQILDRPIYPEHWKSCRCLIKRRAFLFFFSIAFRVAFAVRAQRSGSDVAHRHARDEFWTRIIILLARIFCGAYPPPAAPFVVNKHRPHLGGVGNRLASICSKRRPDDSGAGRNKRQIFPGLLEQFSFLQGRT